LVERDERTVLRTYRRKTIEVGGWWLVAGGIPLPYEKGCPVNGATRIRVDDLSNAD
ncbi:MAG: hypothetical protein HUK20_12745, partial [Fibrobacter sp.]|nr:hypothetical protein [Fibrobacter sp.]